MYKSHLISYFKLIMSAKLLYWWCMQTTNMGYFGLNLAFLMWEM